MKQQHSKIDSLEKLVSTQETTIINQTEKLKEHETLFSDLAKLPKDQRKRNNILVNENSALDTSDDPTRCNKFMAMQSVSGGSVMPQIVKPVPLSQGQSLEEESTKMHLNCHKRKAQCSVDELISPLLCKRANTKYDK